MEEILHRKYPIIYMPFLHPNGGWPWDFTITNQPEIWLQNGVRLKKTFPTSTNR